MTIELKGGFTTKDPRLDRLPQHDPRNLRFLAVKTLDTRTPRSYTWSIDKWLDQGQEGACVGFGFGHDGIARPARLEYIDNDYAREQIYWNAQRTYDEWPGGAYPGADPFYEGTSVLAGAKACYDLNHFRQYEWAYSVEELILAVGYKGPAVLGINWYEGMYDTDGLGYIHPTGEIMGGHAILCNKVSVTGEYFSLHNSWGQNWGINGEAKVSFNDMAILLKNDGEACVPTKRIAPSVRRPIIAS